jgi:hypothetical protein
VVAAPELEPVVALIFEESVVELPAALCPAVELAAPPWVPVAASTPLGWPPATVPVAPSAVVPFVVSDAWAAGVVAPVAAGPMTFSIWLSLAWQSAKAGLANSASATTAAEYFRSFMKTLLGHGFRVTALICGDTHQPFAQGAVPATSTVAESREI